MAYLFTCDGCESNHGSHGHSSKDIKDVYNPVSVHFFAWDFFQVPLVSVVWHMQIILGLESQGVTTKRLGAINCIFAYSSVKVEPNGFCFKRILVTGVR